MIWNPGRWGGVFPGTPEEQHNDLLWEFHAEGQCDQPVCKFCEVDRNRNEDSLGG